MYSLLYPASLFLASLVLSHARHTIFISQDGAHSYLPSSAEPDVCMKPKCVIAASDILTSLDETVDPCDDFYRFACGGWMKRHEISGDEHEINPIVEMQKGLNRKLIDLLESKYESSDPPFVKMLKDFYNTCMDLESMEEKGSEPLRKLLSRLGGWPVLEGDKWDESTFDWVDTLINFRKLGFDHNILVQLAVIPKSQNETVHIIMVGSPPDILPYGSNLTLGLSDPKIEAYLKKMLKAAKLLGADESTAENELLEVLKFMIALKNITIIQNDGSEEESENLFFGGEVTYRTVKEMQEEVPNIPWMKYFNGMFNVAVYEEDTLYIESEIVYFNRLTDLLAKTEKRVIANYMMMRAVLESAQFLSEEWKNIDEEPDSERARWKVCLSQLMEGMEKGLSSYYVRHYFKEESKDEAMILMKYIHKEFLKILKENDWMDEKTREKAEEKANAIKSYIGYPRELLNDTYMMKTYENLTINTDSYLENILAFQKRSVDEMLSHFRKPMDQLMDSRFAYIVRVNAFYNPHENSIGIPASILHDAYYDSDRPNYLNFGTIGYVIGHEITHGFDNQGRHFDKDGNEVNWWDKKTDEHFRKKVQCIIDQYDNYTTDIGLKVEQLWSYLLYDYSAQYFRPLKKKP